MIVLDEPTKVEEMTLRKVQVTKVFRREILTKPETLRRD